MIANDYHIPVMLHPSVDALNIKRDGIYIDVTLGGGGHSREILTHLGQSGRLFSFDQDAQAIAHFGEPAQNHTLVWSNFRFLKNWMRYYNIEGIDGLLADLGVSSHHFDATERGFSFRGDALLDMRMNQQAKLTAAEIVNTYNEEQLVELFRLYGELKQAARIAKVIVKERSIKAIETTGDLVSLLTPVIGRDREKKDLACAFQALRIEVNHEMDALKEMLSSAVELLNPGGRLVVMSYHSLEDRLVKNLMRSGNFSGEVQQDIFGRTQSILTTVGKPIVPDAEEQAANPRSRSAKFRIAEKR